ncbi:MAG: nitroreductase family protein [Halanaerobiales bacterium]|nr:nitroreductase family protein [Halanaerobiales bacterium]
MGNNMVELKDFFVKRKSVRNYKQVVLEQSVITALYEIGQSGPKAGGIDCVEIYVLTDESTKNICYKASYYQEFVRQAPVLMVIGVDTSQLAEKYKDEFSEYFGCQNASIAAQNIILAATQVGLGSCWIGAIRYEYLRTELGVKESFRPWLILTLGYESEDEVV